MFSNSEARNTGFDARTDATKPPPSLVCDFFESAVKRAQLLFLHMQTRAEASTYTIRSLAAASQKMINPVIPGPQDTQWRAGGVLVVISGLFVGSTLHVLVSMACRAPWDWRHQIDGGRLDGDK